MPCFSLSLGDLDLNKVVSGTGKLIKAAAGISDADEQKIGREVAANLAARYGLVDSPSLVHYVNLVGQTLVQQCDRNDIPYHFGILKSNEVNALATPGGYIFITQGLLNTLHDESELAGVLAHEINHVVQRHIVKAIRKANLLGAGEDLAAASGHDVSKYGQLSDFSINLLSKGLSREDELEADKLGTILAAKTGYDPYGLRDSIARLGEKEAGTSSLAQFNKTHPPATDRLQALDKVLSDNHLTDKGPRLADRFRKNSPA